MPEPTIAEYRAALALVLGQARIRADGLDEPLGVTPATQMHRERMARDLRAACDLVERDALTAQTDPETTR